MSAAPNALGGVRKAAVLLVLLGEDSASQIYRHLPEVDLERLTQGIADLDYIDPATALAVLEEYHRMALTQDYVAQGGTDYAQKLLIKAFGEDGAQQLLRQVSQAAEMSAGKLDSLQKADPQQLAKFLEEEHPQTIALTLAHLDAKQASELLMRLPETLRAEALKRMAQIRQFSPEIAQKVSIALHKRLEALGEQHRRAYAGFQGVADLLNRMDPVPAKGILEAIEKEDPKVALGIRNLMFTFQDLLGVPENGNPRLAGTTGQEDSGPGIAWRQRRIEKLYLQIHVVARRRNAERRYGNSGPGALPRRNQSAAGGSGGGAQARSRGQDQSGIGGR